VTAATPTTPGMAGLRGVTGLSVRLRERPFWVVQAGVVGVTVLHSGLEALGLVEHHSGALSSLGHLPVLLYLLPVVYAGLNYGFEGGLRTGAAVAVLSTPNLVLWHSHDWIWVGEAVFVAGVVFVGAAIAIPVERERLQREHAEAARQRAELAEHRVRLLNDVTSTLSCPIDLEHALPEVLGQTVRALRLERAELTREGEPPPGSRPTTLIPVPSIDGSHGGLLVERAVGLDDGERELIEAIATQIGVALDNARMQRDHDAALHSYARGVTAAQEDERRRIARELHDVVAHGLLVVRRGLEEEARPDATSRAHEQLGELVTALRRFSHDLRPGVLEPLGLAPALEWLVTELQEAADARVEAEITGTPTRLSRDQELALYRIAEEALRNALEHAGPGTVRVALAFASDGTTLSVRDDGAGFDPTVTGVADGRRGLGMIGMRERAAACGAELDVRSSPGEGSTVLVRLPCHPEAHTSPPE
jgi:two-component system sensor histidine kinase DegS